MFNTMAIERLARYSHFMRATLTNQGRLLEINFPTPDPMRSQRTSGYAMPQNTFRDDAVAPTSGNDLDAARFVQRDASARIADDVLSMFALHNGRVSAAMLDSSLSGAGKLQRCVASATTALQTLGEQFASLMRIGDRLAADYATLYAPPALDAVSVAVDVEVRARFMALPVADQMQWLAKLAEPVMLPLLTALRRTPLPLQPEQAKLVSEAWVAYVRSQKPDEAAKLEASMQTHAWAAGLLSWIGDLLVNPCANATFGAIERYDAYRLLLPTGGADVLSFTPQEVDHYSRERVVITRAPAAV